jgi:dTDP-4-amino-4,6-dideoxygalactose transaminase
MTEHIPFNRPQMTGNELIYIAAAIEGDHLSGNGPFSRRCAGWLEEWSGTHKALLTPSCTAALEMVAILADLEPGDEVIMPSFTFVSTANAVVLRGGVPVFVDIRPDTLNLDETKVEDAITERTKAIVAVHYAGVACAMDALCEIAARRSLLLVEDAAQALMSTYRGRAVGSFGEVAALSFHETKNVTCGEGGALLVNRADWVERAEIVHEKGTNRQRFFRGQVDKYSWVDIGSSYPMSELQAAFLWSQLEAANMLTEARLGIWRRYHEAFAPLEQRGRLRRPIVPKECTHNGHMYYILLAPEVSRSSFIDGLAAANINAVFHYVPLHSSLAGGKHGRAFGDQTVTDDVSDRLVRLPLWPGLSDAEIARVIASVTQLLES